MVRTLSVATVAALTLAATAGDALAQQGAGAAAQFRAGYGRAAGAEYHRVEPGLRDANGNLLMVNGRIQGQSAYSSMSGAGAAYGHYGAGGYGYGGSTAIGNLLNVVVQGNWNTVIINSTQTNSGDVTAGTELNGNLNLDD